MIGNIYKVSEVLSQWNVSDQKTFSEISASTGISIPHVLQILSEGTGKEFDVSETVSVEDIKGAIANLKKRYRQQIEEREKEIEARKVLAISIYEKTFEKIQTMQVKGLWYQSFKTISYLAGQFAAELPLDLFITAASEAVRCGLKAKANMQELGQWLQKAVAASMSKKSREGIEEALDLIDAYGEAFLDEDSGKGPLIVGNVLAALEEPSARYELWEQYKNLVDQLYPPR